MRPQPSKKSPPQKTAVGSGAKPSSKSKIMIPTSQPKDMHGLDGRNQVKNKPLK